MAVPALSVTSSGAPASAASVQPAESGQHNVRFHDILSALNPLQYLPVVGTIYRAATGDVIPEPLRIGGSLLVSGLLSGPIGLILNIAMTMAEKATGIDPEKIVADELQSPVSAAVPDGGAATGPEVAGPVPLPFSPRQLAAYGIPSSTTGVRTASAAGAADTLNTMELDRLYNATVAYGRQSAPIPGAADAG
ncbi:MAG: hypothetical protein ACJ8AW_32555 [Rhodopila sp.]